VIWGGGSLQYHPFAACKRSSVENLVKIMKNHEYRYFHGI